MAYLNISITDGKIGAIIDGINLNYPIKSAYFELIQNTINKKSVVVIRNQIGLPQNSLVEFCRRFGKLQINVRAEANNAEHSEIFWVSNITENGKLFGSHDAGRYWHSDLCYLEKPSDLTFLHALEIPSNNGTRVGATHFCKRFCCLRRPIG